MTVVVVNQSDQLPIHPSIHPENQSIHSPGYPMSHPSNDLSIYPASQPSIHPSTQPSTNQNFYHSLIYISPPVHPWVHLPVYLHIHPSSHLTIYPSIICHPSSQFSIHCFTYSCIHTSIHPLCICPSITRQLTQSHGALGNFQWEKCLCSACSGRTFNKLLFVNPYIISPIMQRGK